MWTRDAEEDIDVSPSPAGRVAIEMAQAEVFVAKISKDRTRLVLANARDEFYMAALTKAEAIRMLEELLELVETLPSDPPSVGAWKPGEED